MVGHLAWMMEHLSPSRFNQRSAALIGVGLQTQLKGLRHCERVWVNSVSGASLLLGLVSEIQSFALHTIRSF